MKVYASYDGHNWEEIESLEQLLNGSYNFTLTVYKGCQPIEETRPFAKAKTALLLKEEEDHESKLPGLGDSK